MYVDGQISIPGRAVPRIASKFRLHFLLRGGRFLETSLVPPTELQSPEPFRPQWQSLATLGLVTLIALYFLWRVRDILPPFFIAFFFAALLDPVVTRFQRKGVSRVRAVLTIYLLV